MLIPKKATDFSVAFLGTGDMLLSREFTIIVPLNTN